MGAILKGRNVWHGEEETVIYNVLEVELINEITFFPSHLLPLYRIWAEAACTFAEL